MWGVAILSYFMQIQWDSFSIYVKITCHSFFVLLDSDAVAWELAYIPWCYFLNEFSSFDYQQSLLTSATLFLKEEGSEASLPSQRTVLQGEEERFGGTSLPSFLYMFTTSPVPLHSLCR